MSQFAAYKLPGGELILKRVLFESEDGVDDVSSMMLRRPEIDILIKELIAMEECSP